MNIPEDNQLIKKINKDNYKKVLDEWVSGKARNVKLLMMKDHLLNDLHNGDIIEYGFDKGIVVAAEKFGRYKELFTFYCELI